MSVFRRILFIFFHLFPKKTVLSRLLKKAVKKASGLHLRGRIGSRNEGTCALCGAWLRI